MARASAYYFSPQPYCWVCRARVEHWIKISHDVADLCSHYEAVPLHASCHRRKLWGCFGRGVLAAGAWGVGLTALGSLAWNYFHRVPNWVFPPARLPGWLLALTLVWAAWSGLRAWVRAYGRYRGFINDQVHLYTYPAD